MNPERPCTVDFVPIGVRSYPVPLGGPKRPRAKNKKKTKPVNSDAKPKRPYIGTTVPRLGIVADAETTTDPSQKALFMHYAIVNLWRKRITDHGLVVADDLSEANLAIVRQYIEENEPLSGPGRTIRLQTRSQFLAMVNKLCVKDGAMLTGLNINFDMSRWACSVGSARGEYYGGFSFNLFGSEDEPRPLEPRLVIKHLDSKKSFRTFGAPGPKCKDADGENVFESVSSNIVDLRQILFALTSTAHSLKSACEAFGIERPNQKAEKYGVVSSDLLRDCHDDVDVTTQLLFAAIKEFRKHPITAKAHNLFSPASMGKRYIAEFGIKPWSRRSKVSNQLLGDASGAFYGGRTEAHIVKVPVPVVHVDFLSEYSTVGALAKLWTYWIADKIETVDATDEFRALLERIAKNPELVFEKDLWPSFVGFAEVELAGLNEPADRLPVRAQYTKDPSWAVGLNYLHSANSETTVRAYGDLIASVILTGKAPKIVRAFRPVAVGVAKRLKTVAIRGSVPVDPYIDDFFAKCIEERVRTKESDLPAEERDGIVAFLKVIASATSFGIGAEFTTEDLPLGVTREQTIYSSLSDPWTTPLESPETPGTYCYPLIGATVPALGRLLLACLDYEEARRVGTYGFCDTDSSSIVASKDGGFIPCPGGPYVGDGGAMVSALSYADVDEIVAKFEKLNPYDRSAVRGSILKIEDVNFVHKPVVAKDGTAQKKSGQPVMRKTKSRRQVYCYALGPKRYCLFTQPETPGGLPTIVKASEHGLGYLMNPRNSKHNPAAMSEGEQHTWIEDVWQYIVARALGLAVSEPEWFARPAMMQTTISSPQKLAAFDAYNEGKSYADSIKPFNFVISPLVNPDGRVLSVGADTSRCHFIAPFEPDPSKWYGMEFIEVYTKQGFRMTSDPPHVDPECPRRGSVNFQPKTIGQVVLDFCDHSEFKSNAAATHRPARRDTIGLLEPQHVASSTLSILGKELNEIEAISSGEYVERDETQVFSTSDPDVVGFRSYVVPVLCLMRPSDINAACNVSPNYRKRILAGLRVPSRDIRATMTTLARKEAERLLKLYKLPVNSNANVYDPCRKLLAFVEHKDFDEAAVVAVLRAAQLSRLVGTVNLSRASFLRVRETGKLSRVRRSMYVLAAYGYAASVLCGKNIPVPLDVNEACRCVLLLCETDGQRRRKTLEVVSERAKHVNAFGRDAARRNLFPQAIPV
jgi:hypothetical protein